MYHRIAADGQGSELEPALVSAAPDEFAAQMAFLAERRPLVSLELVLAVRRGEAELPPGAVVVTFDDAYRDFAQNAWPVLRSLGVPTTLFVPTAYPGNPALAFWWDRLHRALRSIGCEESAGDLRRRLETMPHAAALAAVAGLEAASGATPAKGAVLSWDELRRLAAEGVTMVAHTRTHPLLHRIAPEAAREEIAASLADLVRELGSSPPALAYPGGGHSPPVAAAARECGIEVGFTTERGINAAGITPWMQLCRVNAGRRASLAVLRAQLVAFRGGRRTHEVRRPRYLSVPG